MCNEVCCQVVEYLKNSQTTVIYFCLRIETFNLVPINK